MSTVLPQRPLLTTAETATLLNVNERTVRRWVADGVLPVIRLGPRSHRFSPDDLTAFMTLSNEQAPDCRVERLQNHGAATPYGTE
jgi:excisionase family DNA binding protein